MGKLTRNWNKGKGRSLTENWKEGEVSSAPKGNGFFKKAFSKAKEYKGKYDEYQKESQTKRIGRLKRDVQEEKLRAQVAKSKSQREKFRPQATTFGGFAGPTKSTPSAGLGVADFLTGSSPFDKPKTVKKKRKKRKSKGRVIKVVVN